MNMPIIPLDKLHDSARFYAEKITVKGALRASKPTVKKVKVPSEKYGYTLEPDDPVAGNAAYVWRMVAFQISPNPKHQCMPCTATFDLPGPHEHQRFLAEELDLIVKEIVDAVPPRQWHGVIRWGQVFGQIGTPRYNEEGAVIYR